MFDKYDQFLNILGNVNIESKYHSVKQSGTCFQKFNTKGLSIFNCNIRSLGKNLCLLNDILVTTQGAFHSTKTFENLETALNGTEISWESFQKFRKLMNFRNANHSTENFRYSGSKVVRKLPGNFFRKLIYMIYKREAVGTETLRNRLKST